ncbi:putative tyrosinase [Rosellinia necatrix]|uniref:tyrosinase n=1 Tax=Rosellinia necatrix TaxID=77044 RepID=A0A1W2TX07_ROSNE|nr:putative tyrosinase [Rosellinia necatrix]
MGRGSEDPVLLRHDILTLQDAYDTPDPQDEVMRQNKLAMQKLLWAFRLLQQADPKNWNSFFRIAGFHGMPFRGAGWGNPNWWGGYCNHGNVLFPTWHRAYVVRLENALRIVSGYKDIALPYWNQTSKEGLENGIPSIFLRPQVVIPSSVTGAKEETIENPLRSYKFQQGIQDNLNPIPDADYSRPKGYGTKRYPFSGLVSGENGPATAQHNWLFSQMDTDKFLNDNVKDWLTREYIINSDGQKIEANTSSKYTQCLDAPTYTVFSNSTSAAQYNEDKLINTPDNFADTQDVPNLPVVPLESPHNDIHAAVGGFTIPGQENFSPVVGANGDMGENDTAGFDPIFYFHHCFVDKVFWDWQKKWDKRTKLEIDVGYPGTNSVDSQGPTPGVSGNTWLTMESPLAPFTKDDSENGNPLTSNDVCDIVGQLRYKYYDNDDNASSGKGVIGEIASGEKALQLLGLKSSKDGGSSSVPVAHVSGINRAAIPGSFIIVAWATLGDKERVVGTESVLSRWMVSGCANCQSHLSVKAILPLPHLTEKELATVRVGLHGRTTRINDLNSDSKTRGGWRLRKIKMPNVEFPL